MKDNSNIRNYSEIVDYEKQILEEIDNERKRIHYCDKNEKFLELLERNKNPIIIRSVAGGIVSGFLLLIIYILLVSLLESLTHAVDSFLDIWYWMIVLVAGFGIQFGLFMYTRQTLKLKKETDSSSKNIAATGGLSAFSMAGCCAHHLFDVLPIIGTSTVAIALADYQSWFIILAITSNILGITFMLLLIKENRLYNQHDFIFGMVENLNLKKVLNTMFILVLVILIVSAIYLIESDKNVRYYGDLETMVDNRNYVELKVTPIDFNFDDQVKFKIEMDTHSVDLDFDLTELSILEDSVGNQYRAVQWKGSPEGGHHRQGTLLFSSIDDSTSYMRLIIKEINGVDRIFYWGLE